MFKNVLYSYSYLYSPSIYSIRTHHQIIRSTRTHTRTHHQVSMRRSTRTHDRVLVPNLANLKGVFSHCSQVIDEGLRGISAVNPGSRGLGFLYISNHTILALPLFHPCALHELITSHTIVDTRI